MNTNRFIQQAVQVNIPFDMLQASYLDRFIQRRLNPEIRLDARTLEHGTLGDFKAIADRLHREQLRVTLHAPYVKLSAGSTDPAIRELTQRRFQQVLDLVPLFRPLSVVCHAGYDAKYHQFYLEHWTRFSLDLWSWLAQKLREQGTYLMLENVYEHEPSEIAVLLKPLRELQVGLCLDTGHCAAFARTPLDPWIDMLGGYIRQLHLHDNNGTWDDHMALGSGRIDFGPLIRFLRSRNGLPPITTIENHREVDLDRSFTYLQHHWPPSALRLPSASNDMGVGGPTAAKSDRLCSAD